MRIHLPQLFPQTEHAETMLAQMGGVKQHDRAPGQFRPPAREVAFDVVVGIPAVDMQQVDRGVAEMVQCVVESRTDQRREPRIPAQVMRRDIPVGVFVVAGPGIHGVAARIQPAALHRLAQGEIRQAAVGPELDQGARAQRLDQPEREWSVLEPRRLRPDPLRGPERSRRKARAQGRERMLRRREPGQRPGGFASVHTDKFKRRYCPDSEVRPSLPHAPKRTSESKDTSNSIILVPLWNPKFATILAAMLCELRVRGTSALWPDWQAAVWGRPANISTRRLE